MLESLAMLLRPGAEMAVAYAAAAYLRTSAARAESEKKKGHASFPLWFSLALALISAALGVYLAEAGFLEREYVEGMAEFASLAGALLLLPLPLLGKRRFGFVEPISSIGLVALLMPSAFRLSRAALTVLKVDVVNSDLLFAASGVALALFISLAYGSFLIRASSELRGAIPAITATAMIFILGFQRLVGSAQFGLSYGYLPLTPELVSVTAPLINRYDYFTYAALASSASFALARFADAVKSDPARLSRLPNPAEMRKERAKSRRTARNAVAIIATLFSVAAVFYAEAYVNQLEKRASELSPAEPVQAEGEFVAIPEAKVNSGQLYRFSYRASDGANVRFIVIHKGSGVYGVGLDYCDICGQTGYYQRGSDVVCKRCDVVINIPTIGIPGGCNPVPLKHRVSAGRLRISAADLEAVKNKFR